MPAPPTDSRVFHSRVLEVTPTGADGFILRVQPDHELPALRAARFFMLRREDGLSPWIPRPFSVYRQRDDGSLEFLIKVMGRGTRALSETAPGTDLFTVGPLGLGWPTLDGEGAPWVMIGGGIGSAPFYMGIEQALAGMDDGAPVDPADITFVYGAARAGHLYAVDAFEQLGVRVVRATDDGSDGFRGNVVQALEDLWARGELPEQVRLLACGPEPMMAAVGRVAEERGLDCWLSLETLMGCGVGICNGCAVETVKDGPLGDWPVVKCCVEGPVFESRAVCV